MNAKNDGSLGSITTPWGLLWALIRYFPWALGVLLIVFGFFVTYVLWKYDVAYMDGSLSVTPKMREATWRGYYVDLGKTTPKGREFYPAFEDFNLDFYESGLVKGISRGEVKQGGAVIRKTWRMSGYHRGEYLFMTFITLREEQAHIVPTGVGSYALLRKGNNYSGYTIYRDSRNDVTLECPYVLTQERGISVEEATRRWPQLKNACREIKFPPTV
jgi:hypothetical protein